MESRMPEWIGEHWLKWQSLILYSSLHSSSLQVFCCLFMAFLTHRWRSHNLLSYLFQLLWRCSLSLFWWQSIYPSLPWLHDCVSSVHDTFIHQENVIKQLYTRAPTGNNPVTLLGPLHTVSMNLLKLLPLSDICNNTTSYGNCGRDTIEY